MNRLGDVVTVYRITIQFKFGGVWRQNRFIVVCKCNYSYQLFFCQIFQFRTLDDFAFEVRRGYYITHQSLTALKNPTWTNVIQSIFSGFDLSTIPQPMKSQTIIPYDYNDKVNERIIIFKRCWLGEVEK